MKAIPSGGSATGGSAASSFFGFIQPGSGLTANISIGRTPTPLANLTTGVFDIAIGYTMPVATTASGVVSIGYEAGLAVVSASNLVLLGNSAGQSVTTAGGMTAVGYQSLQNGNLTAATALGYQSGQAGPGSNSLCLGAYAGKYDVSGNPVFYVNALDRANTAGDTSKSLMYGTFNTNATLQALTINAGVTISQSLQLQANKFLQLNSTPGNGLLFLQSDGTNGLVFTSGYAAPIKIDCSSLQLNAGGGAGSPIILGGPLRLASTYVAGAVLSTGTVAMQDSTGTTYNVLVHT